MSIKDITERVAQPNVYVDTVLFGEPTPFSVTLPAGFRTGFLLGIYNQTKSGHELYNLSMRMRVDTNDADHDWPNGASLTAAQINSVSFNTGLRWDDVREDTLASSLTPNGRYFSFVQTNSDSSTHNYHLRIKVYHFRVVPSGGL